MNKVLFYEDIYYLFSNFSAHAVEYNGVLYPTSEHAYHAGKFEDPFIKEEIRVAKSPMAAKDIANKKYRLERVKNWDEIKVGVMYEIVKQKLLQHEEIQNVLLKTGDMEIIENSPIDYFWGCGADGSGQNQLGKIWMRLREEFDKSVKTNPTI